MNKKKIIASILSVVLVAGAFTSCGNSATPGKKNDKALEKSPETIEILSEDEKTTKADVTAITAGVDGKGKVVDKTGIIDVSGHRIYSTGEKDNKGLIIYTTGKKATNGHILYTKNTKNSFGEQIYYTGYYKGGKLWLSPTTEKPDYTTNEKPQKYVTEAQTTTTTKGYKSTSNLEITGAKTSYIKFFGGTGMDFNRGITACRDGGYAAICFSYSTNGSFDGIDGDYAGHTAVVKYDADGKQLWKYVTGGDGDIMPESITELKDGSLVVAGVTAATDTDAPKHSDSVSSLIIKLSKSGKLLWMYSFPGDSKKTGDQAKSVAATPDGGFLVGGQASSNAGFFKGDKESTAYLFKFDKNCNLKWRKSLAGSKANYFAGIDVADNGDIYTTCVTTSSDGDFSALVKGKAYTKNTVLLKLNKNGDLKWSKNLDGSGNSEFNHVIALKDGCAVAGSYSIVNRADGIYNLSYGKSDGYVIRYDKDGNVCWAHNYGGSDEDYIHGFTRIDGGFAIAGTTKSSDFDFQGYGHGGEEDAFVIYLNEQGETAAVVILDGTKADSILGLATLKDGCVAAAGWTQSSDNAFKGSKAGNQYLGYVAKFETTTKEKDK